MSNVGAHCFYRIHFAVIYSDVELRILMGQYIEELRLHNNKSSSLPLSSLGDKPNYKSSKSSFKLL